jgi:hypothetical protein
VNTIPRDREHLVGVRGKVFTIVETFTIRGDDAGGWRLIEKRTAYSCGFLPRGAQSMPNERISMSKLKQRRRLCSKTQLQLVTAEAL